MIIGLLTVKLRIPMAHSLKDKRRVIKSLREKCKNKFNIAVAEIDQNDIWQNSILGVVTISNKTSYVDKLMNKVIHFIENFNGLQLIDYTIEHF